MNSKYEKGQRVIIKPLNNQSLSPRDCTIEPYVGQVGVIINYYVIGPRAAQAFYIYNVRVGANQTELALHEDEIEAYREQEHKQKWPGGHIKQVGNRTTEEAARDWEKEQGAS